MSRTHGLWMKTATVGQPFPRLSGAVEADVAIIGGGYGGLSAALRLAEAGVDVALIEAEHIGFGGAGRNTGLVNAGLWVMPDVIVRHLGPFYGERLIDTLGQAPSLVFDLIARHGIDCEAERGGTLHCAVGAAGLAEIEERGRQWAARGVKVNRLASAETAARTGSPRFAGALEDRRAGTIQPLSYARGLASAAARAGARIFTASTARRLERSGRRWRVFTHQGRLCASWLLVAGESYSLGALAPQRLAQIQLPFFNAATPSLAPEQRAAVLVSGQALIDTARLISAIRFDRAGRLIIGSVGALRGAGRPIHQAWARRMLARCFPQIEPLRFEAAWHGAIGLTGDHLPGMTWLGENALAIGGYNGRGIAPGTAFGRLAADFIVGAVGEAALPVPIGQPERRHLRRWREAWLEAGVAVAHLAEHRLG
ncbi:NAD(P)/FAD-dependent oxidoreductase [Labrys neptuniae]